MENSHQHKITTQKPLAVDTKTAAVLLSLAPKTLINWRYLGVGPDYLRLGTGRNARVLYSVEDLEHWLLKQRVKGR